MKRIRIVTVFLLSALPLASCANTPETATQAPGANAGTGEATAADGAGTQSLPAQTESEVPKVETTIREIGKYGHIVLDVLPAAMAALGYEPADVVLVEIGEIRIEMPVGLTYSDVDVGSPLCRFKYDREDGDQVLLAINSGNLAADLGIAEVCRVEEDPGFAVDWGEGFGPGTPVTVSMAEKQGYAEEYKLHNLAARTNERADYADLSDEEYANFRAVETTGMGRGALYRASSPIDPDLNRNKEADGASGAAGTSAFCGVASSKIAGRWSTRNCCACRLYSTTVYV